MQTLIEKYRSIVVLCVICAVGLAVYMFKSASSAPVEEPPFIQAAAEEEVKEPEQIVPESVFVDVKGAVVNPGLYEVKLGDRLKFVIDRAGGFTEDADEKMMNLATKVSDEMMIYVPKKGEVDAPIDLLLPIQEGGSDSDKLNINTATQQEFETLPGIGPAKAAAFVQYRDENGPFASIEDIQKVSGIGEKTFEKLKEQISVQ
ncbi:helix-hairpin-helix domain-containing protein [Bacillus sp. KH172YL63]|uniref:helix-hairpin-helix domain-containing protein n=1 Tax=Bacillus sp. KH172YL63 TaxID=2709784 RepID=UPI0013E4E309|nr:helix-hairpin-helix domain-containing protein [Bacillus sp. KH172YL63]BCB04896.1 ComE operon protein 1 [Bacillus sp. KH172YL63]